MNPKQDLRAVIYLRVSSAGQVKTDYDPEGLSIPAQREACLRHAERLGAQVVREYVEPGVSGGSILKRTAFRRMLEEVRERRDVDYVIVWSVSRWARDQEDHWTARGLITRAGAKLASVKEPIGEDTAHGVMLEGVMAAVAAARRIEISEEVTRGIKRKIEVGGTHSRAPIGYLNVREPLPGGGEVRTVVIDPERGPLVAWAFEAYASGMYSLSDMVTLLEVRGLRTRPTARWTSQPLGPSSVHKMLGNPYYTGVVVFKGSTFPGRHDALISEELFDQVKGVLDGHRLAGERDRKHSQYLKGSVFCGACGRRLTYSQNKGNGGLYEYFVCTSNQRGVCAQGYQPVALVEQAVERHYGSVRLSAAEAERVRHTVASRLGEMADTAEREIARCRGVLAQVKAQERKLLHMHYQERISDELFDEEQARLRRERLDADSLIARLDVRHEDIAATLELALDILGRDLQDLYAGADDATRRLMNQSLFAALYVCDEEVVGEELAEPFARVRALSDALAVGASVRTAATVPVMTKAASPGEGVAALVIGSISEEMVGRLGLEPRTLGLKGGAGTSSLIAPSGQIWLLRWDSQHRSQRGELPALAVWWLPNLLPNRSPQVKHYMATPHRREI